MYIVPLPKRLTMLSLLLFLTQIEMYKYIYIAIFLDYFS